MHLNQSFPAAGEAYSAPTDPLGGKGHLLPFFPGTLFPLLFLMASGLREPSVNARKKGSPYSIAERRVPELISVLGSQPAGDMSHKPGGRLPLLSARPAVTHATLKRAATSFAAW